MLIAGYLAGQGGSELGLAIHAWNRSILEAEAGSLSQFQASPISKLQPVWTTE